MSASKWRQLNFDGLLSTIDIADDGTCVGTTPNDDILYRSGYWRQLPGKLRQVSTGGLDKYVGVNAQQ